MKTSLITAFIALFIAFVSLVLLTQVPPIDDQPAIAKTTWGESVAAAPDRCDPEAGDPSDSLQAGR